MAEGEGSNQALSHLDARGESRMVDVSGKDESQREALARGYVHMKTETLSLITEGRSPKGDVLAVARVAGIMAAKRTSDLIPLCHPLPITGVELKLAPNFQIPAIEIEATVRTTARTGVEMEALTAVAVAALTVYDMCKSAERGMHIEGVRLIAKSGGRSGEYRVES